MQLNRSNWLCPGEHVLFKCSEYNTNNQLWKIRTASGLTVSFNLNEHILVGTSLWRQYGTFSTSTEITAINSTSIVSTITFFNATSLNNTLVQCNNDIINIFFQKIGKLF